VRVRRGLSGGSPEPLVRDGPEDTSVVRQAGDRDADVVVDPKHLLLIRRELAGRTLLATEM